MKNTHFVIFTDDSIMNLFYTPLPGSATALYKDQCPMMHDWVYNSIMKALHFYKHQKSCTCLVKWYMVTEGKKSIGELCFYCK